VSTLSAGIVGATGYAGAELTRLLLAHPMVNLEAVISRSRAGERLDSVHPSLLGFTDLRVSGFDAAALAPLDVVFLATPHGTATALASDLKTAGCGQIIDLSQDHRHTKGWVYGQAEWHRDQLPGAQRISVPGCFATAISLALAPFVSSGLLSSPVQCVAATGSTGSGVQPSATTHHPERVLNLKSYKVLRHQHTPEITTFLQGLGAFERLDFVPISAPVDRGILATCFVQLPPSTDPVALLQQAYSDHWAARVRDAPPELRHVRGTGFCDLWATRHGDTVVVQAAIDNLGKGAAAHAIQCLNLSHSWPLQSGLSQPPALP
jgi:N-acetyl-gamma-glutamyl-phosphate reductase